MEFKRLDNESITSVIDPIYGLKRKWDLVTAEVNGEVATLTCSWGSLGHLWNKPVFTVYIRPQRYTKPFIDTSKRFTVTFFDGYMDELTYLGRTSTYNVKDKIEKSGLHITHINNDPTFVEGKYVVVCKLLYAQSFEKDCFIDQNIPLVSYPNDDYSIVYIGEIEGFYEIVK